MPASDAALLDELTGPAGGLGAAAAEAVLSWRFTDATLDRMRALAARNAAGELSPGESEEFDRLKRVGLLADVLHAKARATRARTASAPATADAD